MPLAQGRRFGRYEIVGAVGAGGMGEVYRARDLRLGRTVAFKILSPSLSKDPQHQQRFQREARVISSLNHPHVCALYDVGEENEIAFLVMEYLEGETLAERLRRGPLPASVGLRYAIEIAAALDHAHRLGVIHRDLKPGNVMLTASGTKLLDFGLAKLQLRQAVVTASTETTPDAAVTAAGAMLGTFQYMAPEQLEGKEADARTDLFAFGALVHEMLTGKRAFEGASRANLIAAILTSDPPPASTLTPSVPPGLDHVISRCLTKNPDDRWQTARDLMLELRAIERRTSGTPSSADSGTERTTEGIRQDDDARRVGTGSRLAWKLGIAAALTTAVAVWLWWRAVRESDSAPSVALAQYQSEIPPPQDTSVGTIALSPDGQRLAFVGRTGAQTQLWVRALNAVAAQPLAGTDGAAYPFWSADGRNLGFFAEGKLKRIDASGGPPVTLSDAPSGRGGTWSEHDVIVFAPNILSLHRVAASGGMSEPITGLDFSRGEISHRWPRFLPGGQHFLYLAQSSRSENTGLFIGSLDGRLKKLVGRADFNGIYSAPGHLLFLRDSMLVAQPFDLERLTLEGSPIAIAGPVSVDGLEHAHFDATSAGVLVYRRGGFLGNSELVWFGRNRQRLGTVGSRADFRGVRLSPSPQNQYVAAVTEDSSIKTPDIWIHRLGSNDHERFTLDVGTDNDPVWSPDSQHIAFRSAREGRLSLFLRPLAGIKKEELLLESDAARNARLHDWSSDGRLLFTQVDPTGKTDRDIWVKPIHGDGRAYPLVQAPLDQDFPRFSPNGRWVAFQTTEAGVRKVFVAPSSGSSRTWEIAAGGSQPIWNPNGTELFYLSADNTIMAVEIGDRDATLKSGTPRPVLSAPLAAVSGWSYDVADNGRRFLLILAVDNPAPVTLLVNWSAQLKK